MTRSKVFNSRVRYIKREIEKNINANINLKQKRGQIWKLLEVEISRQYATNTHTAKQW